MPLKYYFVEDGSKPSVVGNIFIALFCKLCVDLLGLKPWAGGGGGVEWKEECFFYRKIRIFTDKFKVFENCTPAAYSIGPRCAVKYVIGNVIWYAFACGCIVENTALKN